MWSSWRIDVSAAWSLLSCDQCNRVYWLKYHLFFQELYVIVFELHLFLYISQNLDLLV